MVKLSRLYTDQDLSDLLDEALEKNEAISIYTPFHELLWNDSYFNSKNYLDYVRNRNFNEYYIKELFSSSPFKIVKLNISYETKTDNYDVIKITKAPEDDFDVRDFVYKKFISQKTEEERNKRVEDVCNMFCVHIKSDKNTLYITLPATHKQRKIRRLFSISEICHTDMPFFTGYKDAMTYILNILDIRLKSTLDYITRTKKKIFTPPFKTHTFGVLKFDHHSEGDQALFRKIMLRNYLQFSKIYEDFKKNKKDILNKDFSNIDYEGVFNYRLWNKLLCDLLTFRKNIKHNKRLEYFCYVR